MCKKEAKELGVLKILSFLDAEKKLIFNAAIKSHFRYCLLIWMFSSLKFNNLINRIHKRSLRTSYDDMMI